MHPILDEILRAKEPPSPAVLKRWQRIIRDEILNRATPAQET